jgi:hypothetical protein
MLAIISALAGIFGVAFFWFWGAIPAGVALGLNPILVAVTVWLSYVIGAAAVILLGEPIRVRLMKRFAAKGDATRPSPVRRVWDRFGLIGLSLLSPITLGSQIGTALGLSLGVKPQRLIAGMAFGAAVWTVGLTVATLLGLTAIHPGR